MTAVAEQIEEVEHHLLNMRHALAQMDSATSATDLRNAWEGYLASFSRAIGRLIAFGKKDLRSREWSGLLKRASENDDPGLLYLREARNTVEHPREAFATFRDPLLRVGDVPLFSGPGKAAMTFQNCIVNGRPTGDFHIETQAGRVISLKGAPLVSVVEVPASVLLDEVRTNKGKTVVPVPDGIMRRKIISRKPVELAERATEFIFDCLQELKTLWEIKDL